MDVTPKQNDKKKTPPGIVRESVEFFEELPIPISTEDGESIIVFMRPLKVKEIPILNRIIYLQERDTNSEQAIKMLVLLAANTLSVSNNEIPTEIHNELVQHMIEFNFPKKDDNPEKKPNNKQEEKDGLINCFDFLIANGHSYSDIMNYPVKIFNNFIIVTMERLGIKQKPIDPATAFRKLGLPVKPRGNKQ